MPEYKWIRDAHMILDNDANSTPRALVSVVNAIDSSNAMSEEALLELLETHKLNDPLANILHRALLKWDDRAVGDWPVSAERVATQPHTVERRHATYELLGLSQDAAKVLDNLCPAATEAEVVISTVFEPWYDESTGSRVNFYWKHYEEYLLKKGWGTGVVTGLDLATTDVVKRLSDPTRETAKHTRGLVIGYVQSGKTANFTGVAAKAIDAGYRLVIVLTGTVEMLRAQTQRRLDKELVGRENLQYGLDVEGETWEKEFDYAGDPQWGTDAFVSHGEIASLDGVPTVIRATTLRADYKRLKQELTKLQFAGKPKKTAPLNDPENLAALPAYLAVVKKNSPTLKKLITDLKAVGKKTLAELPILIIDDESDQASIDTTNPKANLTSADVKKRTAINRAISEILSIAPRAQYVGYTATPFANVFVDPTDDQDIFPSDFLVTLPRPANYMGVFDFHDLGRDWEDDHRDMATSNEDAHVRFIEPDIDAADLDAEMCAAIDSFVLAGALKLYRGAHHVSTGDHHTMLVHESVRKAEHADTAARVRGVWDDYPTNTAAGLARLEKLWHDDFLPVCTARAGDLPVPGSFSELTPYVGDAVARISSSGDPVIVINSDTDLNKNKKKLDFDSEPVWKILVGGTKLSRGFTVEGLTTSYFRRSTGQGDTLMQAGRWFGFRKGYRDLVRLHIPGDIYRAFGAVLEDEEEFRDELRKYEGFDAETGKPLLTPQAIPPLVMQHLPAVKLTARNKMWNAELVEQGATGTVRDLYNVPGREAEDSKERNFVRVLPLLERATLHMQLSYQESGRGKVEALTGIVEPDELHKTLKDYEWHDGMVDQVRPQVAFFLRLCRDEVLSDWALVWPQTGGDSVRTIAGTGVTGSIIHRTRRAAPRVDFSGSDRKHRVPVEALVEPSSKPKGVVPLDLVDPAGARGAVLVYLVWDPVDAELIDGPIPEQVDPQDISVLLSFAVPDAAAPDLGRVLKWKRRQDSDLMKDKVAIDVDEES